MKRRRWLHYILHRKSTAFCFVFLLATYSLFAQTGCSCPPLNTCSACSGGLTFLKMEYTPNSTIIDMTASDNDGVLPFTFVGKEISINSRASGQPFNGDVVITVTKSNNTQDDVTVNSSCVSPIAVGDPIQNFKVRGAASIAGPICCSNSEMDKVKPSLTGCPTDISVSADQGGCTAIVSWIPPTAADNCGNVTLTSTHNPGATFTKGTTLVTYTATDDFDNTRTCSFNVIVTEANSPVISNCPADISVSTNAPLCGAIVSWVEPAASDCDLESFTADIPPGSSFPVGVTTVTYTAKDIAANVVTCSFNVTVTDKTPPVFFNCPTAIQINADQSCGALVNWVAPTAADNCTSASVTSSHTPGSTFAIGTTTVTYTAVDVAGNTAICSFSITVADNTPPLFSNCPASIRANVDPSCNARVTWTAPTATDNCSSVSITSSHTPGSTFPVGTTSVIYTATDVAGNSSQCQFDVIVSDVNASLTNCVPDIKAMADESGKAIITWQEPGIISVCGNLSLTSTYLSGSAFPIGTTQVTYTLLGSNATCQFNVIVDPIEVSFEVIQQVSPNGDGINDTWKLPNIEHFKNNKVILLDRWGGLVYEASGYDNESVVWNGTNTKGSGAPTGTYFYTITVEHDSHKVKQTGFIELIR